MSIDETYIRMMNEEIDGVISGEDAKKLSIYVNSDPEAGRYYEELRAAVDRFWRSLPDVTREDTE